MKKEWADFIDELKRKSDIVDIVSMYAPLQQKGRRYWARCPLHGEKTPSFSITADSQTFYCFGCKKHGDVIKFVEEAENMTFSEAVDFLANRAGLKKPGIAADDEKIIQKKKLQELCKSICLDTAKYYYSVLISEKGEKAREYLLNRGLKKEIWTTFGLGYSDGFDGLPKYLLSKGYKMEDCITAGVILKSQKGDYYDALFNRVIVPIIDGSGVVIAFGGRVITQSNQPKYKNTAETPIFEKSKTLFGINLLKKQKTTQKMEGVVIVEGYMDVLALYSAGITNCVAGMGTALSKQQAGLLRRFADKIYVCYDGDSAGQAATLRGLEILKETGLDVYIMTLPDNLDPDEYVRKYGAERYKTEIIKALPLVDYRLALLKKEYDLNAPVAVRREENRRKYISKALPIIDELNDIDKESYILKIAKETGYDKEFLKGSLKKENIQLPKENTADAALSAEQKALLFIAKALLAGKEWEIERKPNFTIYPALIDVYEYCFECRQNFKKPLESMAYQLVSDDNLQKELIGGSELNESTDKQYYYDCLAFLEKKELENELKELTAKYDNVDAHLRVEMLSKITKITQRINEIKKVLEERI